MRITLNLASKPFIELRPLFARLRWWMALLVLISLPLWLFWRTERRKAALADARLQSVESEINRLQNLQQSSQAMMRQPQNAAVLTEADFLNSLFREKGFSWTAVMMDLENVLPGGVQVMNIDPEIDKAGNVIIRLRVNGQRDRAVELVRNLEHSRRFLQPRLASESIETSAGNQANFQPASTTSNVNFDILADYNPLPPAAKKPEKATEPSSGTGSSQRSHAAAPQKRRQQGAKAAPLRPSRNGGAQ